MSIKLFHRVPTIILLVILAAFFSPVQAAPGDIDLTFAGFGSAGVVIQGPAIYGTALQPDGKIVTVGLQGSLDLAVNRYLPNGQPDTSFDGDGKVVYENMFTAVSVAIQSDGRIVVGGTRNEDFQLARLTPSGALDTSFDGDGWVEDFDAELYWLQSILVQPDSKIVACGWADVGGDFDFGVTRYNTNGSRDNSFGGDGKVTIPFGAEDYCRDLVLQNDGKLVVVGKRSPLNFGDDDFAVARLEINGTLDNDNGDGGFDGDGKLTTGFGGDEEADAVVLQPDGKIVVLGSYIANSYMARYKPDGSLDGSFGSGGKLTIPNDNLEDLVLQPDGKIVALGYHQSPDGDNKFAIHRLLPNGTPDTTFDLDGIAWLDFGGNDKGKALALQPDGRILAAGHKDNTGVLVRLWPDGTFDSGGRQTHSLAFPPVYPPGSDAITSALAVQPDGKLLAAGELRNPSGGSSDAFISRFLADGRLDTNFGVQGTVRLWIGNFNGVHAIALQPDGMIVIAGYSDFGVGWVEFMVARFYPDGAPDTTFGTNGNNYRIANFSNGPSTDKGYALALAPDGKIVVAGNAWNGSRQVWGVARWNGDGTPDTTFGTDGKVFVDFNGSNAAKTVVVQPDRKIIIGGDYNTDFFLQRLLESGAPDPNYGINGGGYNITDMGGVDSITTLALAPDGWLYAGGYTLNGGADNFALAQYQPDGILAQCQAGQPCNNWPDGRRYVDIGGLDLVYSILLRGDNQLVAAGCSDWHMAAAQVSTTNVNAQPLLFQTDFVGEYDCAKGAQFSDANKDKIVLAGLQAYNFDYNIALARFETTPDGSVPPPPQPPSNYRLYLPGIVR